MPYLKPCPFCGWKVEFGDGNETEPCVTDEGEKLYVIACPDCGAGVAPSDTLSGVIYNWNRRADIKEEKILQHTTHALQNAQDKEKFPTLDRTLRNA
jgi:endogenous inhibitor of DNA gyrase (YacG/DUF329 family)